MPLQLDLPTDPMSVLFHPQDHLDRPARRIVAAFLGPLQAQHALGALLELAAARPRIHAGVAHACVLSARRSSGALAAARRASSTTAAGGNSPLFSLPRYVRVARAVSRRSNSTGAISQVT